MRFLFQLSQQINPVFLSDDGRDCTKDAKDDYTRGPFHRRVIKNGHSKNFGHERTILKHDKIEVH